jgi:hypothetical protein
MGLRATHLRFFFEKSNPGRKVGVRNLFRNFQVVGTLTKNRTQLRSFAER